MNLSIDPNRLWAALEKLESGLLAERSVGGHWVGQLSSSPLATATALSALVIAEQSGSLEQHGRRADQLFDADQIFQSDLSELIVHSLHWLACQQNEDGGWGDTDRSRSNIATTLLVNATFHLTGVPAKYSGLLERAEKYIRQQGGVAALRKRYGRDKTLSVPILTNCALAGLVSWKDVIPLPFELAVLPHAWQRVMHLPVVSFALPALIALGQCRFYHAPPANPLVRLIRKLCRSSSLKLLEQLQPASGGFLQSTPLTSFVVMGLASIGLAEHPIVRRGVEFLLESVRGNGSWPAETNLALWNTSLAVTALAANAHHRPGPASDGQTPLPQDQHPATAKSTDSPQAGRAQGWHLERCLDWLLKCQHRATSDSAGGWAWTDLSGGAPDVASTSQTLLGLAALIERVDEASRSNMVEAAAAGVRWLLQTQDRDGGWPSFCRKWDRFPFDRTASDLTAAALRGLNAWRHDRSHPFDRLETSVFEAAIEKGIAFLRGCQRADGAWVPLWFGNEDDPREENPVFGTSRVLIALADLGYHDSEMAQKGRDWLCQVQHTGGGWGAVVAAKRPTKQAIRQPVTPGSKESITQKSSIEETAVAVTALLAIGATSTSAQHAASRGLAWLVDAVENGHHDKAAPIGFYFAKLWYYERLYPWIFAVEALRTAAVALSNGSGDDCSYLWPSLQSASL